MFRLEFLICTLLLVTVTQASSSRNVQELTICAASIVRLDGETGLTKGTIGRTELTEAERSEQLSFQVALKMRNIHELRARIADGETISQSEMAEKYYPEEKDFNQIANWLAELGIEVQPADITRLSVMAKAPIATVENALLTKFVRVRGIDGKEYSSAAVAPSIPSGIARFALGFNGLQPHLRTRFVNRQLRSMAISQLAIGPQDVLQYYNASGLGLDGAGQTIAVIMDAKPSTADLSTFWSNTGVGQSLSNYTVVNRGWVQDSASSTASIQEATLDIEWAGAIAPKAALRLYESTTVAQWAPAILGDLSSFPNIRQVTLSGGSWESGGAGALLYESESQYYAALAAAGISVFVASGDWGKYSAHDGNSTDGLTVAVLFPASDPCVTAVGGSNLSIGSPSAEAGWGRSGGGTSVIFPQPEWQTGLGLPHGLGRFVPDVAAIASSDNRDIYFVLGGSVLGVQGTSLSSPIWAGFCALINQSRAINGLGSVGLLGPRIYPLLRTSAFHDISTTDSNLGSFQGATAATSGWDECTGLGSPNIANLISALASTSNPSVFAPRIIAQSGDQTTNAGATVNISITATTPSDSPILSYQWRATDPNFTYTQDLDAGNSTWVNMVDGPNIVGSSASTLTLSKVSVQTSLDKFGFLRSYDCVVQNQYGFTYSSGLTITVTGTLPTITSQPASASAFLGGSASFSVSASNAVTYQWLKDGVPINAGSSSTLALSDIQASDAGNYTCTVSNAFGSVSSNAATLTISTSRLVNLSTRSFVGTGASIQIAGFVITGSEPKTLLIRACGPALTPAPYNVSGTVADPALALYLNQTVIAQNDDWSSDSNQAAALSSAFTSTGAFPFARGSKDAALLVTLNPGAYTAQVTGKNGGTGVALVEVYEVGTPPNNRLINISTRSETRTGGDIQIAGFVIGGNQPKTLLVRANGPALAPAPYNVTGTLDDPVLTLFDSSHQIAQNDDWSSSTTTAANIENAVKATGAFAWPRGSRDAALLVTLQPGAYTAQVSGKNGNTGVTLIEVYEVP